MAALAKIELFNSLYELLSTYPSPPGLRESLLDHLLAELRVALPDDPLAVKLSATRFIRPEAAGEELVEALKNANETLLAAVTVNRKKVEGFLRVYADFIEDWCRSGIDSNLVRSLANCDKTWHFH